MPEKRLAASQISSPPPNLARRLSPLEALPDALLHHITDLLPVLPDLLSLAAAAPGISVARGDFWRGVARDCGCVFLIFWLPWCIGVAISMRGWMIPPITKTQISLGKDVCLRPSTHAGGVGQQQRRTRRVAKSLRSCPRRALFRAYSQRALKVCMAVGFDYWGNERTSSLVLSIFIHS